MINKGVNKRSVGINFTEEDIAEVVVWAPLAEQVEVVLNETERLELSRGEDGYWNLTTSAIKPGSKYLVSIDGQKPLPDPCSLAQPDGVHKHSVALHVTRFNWQDQAWTNPSLDEYVLYELHTGTFSQEGTFQGIANKLEYLLELGITAIEIMPVASFPGCRNWGYDGVFPFAVQECYGGAQGLQELVNACHQNGIAVILDVVYNHLGPEGNYLGSFGPFFTDKYKTPWGSAINFDDAWCDGVRQYFIDNALMWFRDFHIDALRMDAVHAIKDFSAVHILQEIRLRVDDLMQQTGRSHHLIVELDLNDTRFINPVDKGGFGMDAQWIDEFHHALRISSGGDRMGYYEDFDGVEHLAKSYRDAYVYDGQYSAHRKKKFGIPAENNEGKQFIVFSQNHDQVGNRMLGERTSVLVSFNMQKLLAGAVMISPFLPMLFMGEEYAETNPFLYFISHTDPDLVQAVRKGRKEEFAAFHAVGEAPDPDAEETFNGSKLQWSLIDKEPHNTMFRFYKALIALRKNEPLLKDANRKSVTAWSDAERRMVFIRRSVGERELLCVLNFSPDQQEIPEQQGGENIVELFNSSSAEWTIGDSKSENNSTNKGNNTTTVMPESFIILANNV